MSAVVVGGGVAGAAAACRLAADGRSVLLIEREAGPHDKICGEFISHEAGHYLGRLGLSLPALGAAPIGAVRLVHGDRVARTPLPFPAYGLSRRVLDEALLARAAASGATVVRGQAVRGLDADGGVDVDGLGVLRPGALFLATGKHDLRGARRVPLRPPEELIGFKLHYALAPAQREALRGHVEVLLLRDGYAGLQPVEQDRANLCLLIRREAFTAAGGTWPGLAEALGRECPHLARRLAGAVPLMDRPLTIFRVPYGHLHTPAPSDPPGLFRLGDQVGVIPSFCGDGVSIALHSAFAATAAESAAEYHARMRRDLGGQIGRAGWMYRAGRAAPGLAVRAARLWPGVLRWAARLTRIPAGALLPVPPR